MFNRLGLTEKLILLLVILMMAAGYILYFTDLPTFLWYVKEDHLVEWLTVVGLILGSICSFGRFFRLLRQRHWWFLLVTFLLGLMLFIAAGEEISWGQRIFGIRSSEYFKTHNAQGETNLHNLVVDGVKLNKLIFTVILGIGMAIYLLVIPFIYNKSKSIKNFLDRSGVPVAQAYQVVAFALMAIIVSLLPHEKNAELLECGAALTFFLIIRYPRNPELFWKANLRP